MLAPPKTSTIRVASFRDEFQESVQVYCTPTGFMDDAVVLNVISDRAYPSARPEVRFDHQPHRDRNVDDLDAAAAFVEAYGYLVHLARWIIEQRAAGLGVLTVEQKVECSLQVAEAQAVA